MLDEKNINQTNLSIKNGDKHFILNGQDLSFKLKNFWQWSMSDLISNTIRGILAEFIVAIALDIKLDKPREEWSAYDLVTSDGIKIEVKSASYIQSWNQNKYSKISFSIRPSLYWDSKSNRYGNTKKRWADIYVFSLLYHKDINSINPLNLNQWKFFVVSTSLLNKYKKNQKTISLTALEKMTTPVSFDKLKNKVYKEYKTNLI